FSVFSMMNKIAGSVINVYFYVSHLWVKHLLRTWFLRPILDLQNLKDKNIEYKSVNPNMESEPLRVGTRDSFDYDARGSTYSADNREARDKED
ncbi:hypothetical protein Tco_0630703, partial [Tanacetum coccineum]